MQTHDQNGPRGGEERRATDDVFPAAFLVWTDEESGEELQIALYGPEDLIASLLDDGFQRRIAESEHAPRTCVRIQTSTRA